jgi:hypothetical protein
MSILEFKHWQLEVESDLSKYDNFQHYLHVYRISSEIELSSIIYLCIGSLAKWLLYENSVKATRNKII